MAEDADDAAFEEPDNTAAVEKMQKAMRELQPTPITSMTEDEIGSLITDAEEPPA
jgi:hypothetical protein